MTDNSLLKILETPNGDAIAEDFVFQEEGRTGDPVSSLALSVAALTGASLEIATRHVEYMLSVIIENPHQLPGEHRILPGERKAWFSKD